MTFLNPTGQDLVFLAESADRSQRIDFLEYAYFQRLLEDDKLASHYGTVPIHQRYGGGCRDVSVTIPQHLVALHAATASHALTGILVKQDAQASLWTAHSDGSVTHTQLPTPVFARQQSGTWTIWYDPKVICAVRTLREQALTGTVAVETGGTLVGAVDLDQQSIYVTGIIGAPTDSRHYPAAFERGAADLRATYEEIESRTAGALMYVGEWHTHPRGARAQPSQDDERLFDWIARMLAPDGLPPVMLIVGEEEERWFVDRLEGELYGSQ